jgi:molybdopterin-binding protein
MPSVTKLLTVRSAASRLGVAYSTLKRWVHAGHVRTTRTAGGHNRLHGFVEEVRVDGLLAQVRMRVGDQTLTAVITADGVRALRLRRGDDAIAIVKSTEVMIARGPTTRRRARVEARPQRSR